MAQKIIILTTDDLDGSKDANTHTFGIDGTNYEIDLSEANSTKFREALEPYVNAARRISGSRKQRRTAVPETRQREIRRWAMENNLDVSPRGRVSGAIIEQYEAAH